MIAGGIVAAFLGVKAEGKSESIAQPLTAEDDSAGGGADGGSGQDPTVRLDHRTPADRRGRASGTMGG